MVLRAVAAHGSVTGAAAALSYSPSAVSQQLARLERELGAELVRRHGRRITMTPLGHELANHAAALLELAEEFELRATRRQRVRQRLRICAFPHAIPWLVAPALVAQAAALRDVEIEIDVVTPEIAVRKIRHGYAQVALIYSASPTVDRLDSRLLATVAPHLVAKADGRFPPPALRDCQRLPWVLPAAGTSLRTFIDEELAQAGVEPNVVATATTLDGVASLVEAGLGVSLLPPFGFAAAANGLVSRVPEDATRPLSISAVVGDGGSFRSAVEVLLDAIERIAAGTPYPAPEPRATTEPPAEDVVAS